jgi:hypothetical protein
MDFKVVAFAVIASGVIGCGGSTDKQESADSATALPSSANAPNNAAASTGQPANFMLVEHVERGSLGDSSEGAEFAETCGPDELLIGLNVDLTGWLEQISGVCQGYSLRSNVSGTPYGYSFHLGARHALAPHPALTTSRIQPLLCPEGTVMVGVSITQQHTAPGTAADAIVIPQLSIDCGTPLLTESQLEWRYSVRVGPAEGSFAPAEDWSEGDLLDDSEISVGYHGAAGNEIDRVGLIATSLDIPVGSNSTR